MPKDEQGAADHGATVPKAGLGAQMPQSGPHAGAQVEGVGFVGSSQGEATGRGVTSEDEEPVIGLIVAHDWGGLRWCVPGGRKLFPGVRREVEPYH